MMTDSAATGLNPDERTALAMWLVFTSCPCICVHVELTETEQLRQAIARTQVLPKTVRLGLAIEILEQAKGRLNR